MNVWTPARIASPSARPNKGLPHLIPRPKGLPHLPIRARDWILDLAFKLPHRAPNNELLTNARHRDQQSHCGNLPSHRPISSGHQVTISVNPAVLGSAYPPRRVLDGQGCGSGWRTHLAHAERAAGPPGRGHSWSGFVRRVRPRGISFSGACIAQGLPAEPNRKSLGRFFGPGFSVPRSRRAGSRSIQPWMLNQLRLERPPRWT